MDFRLSLLLGLAICGYGTMAYCFNGCEPTMRKDPIRKNVCAVEEVAGSRKRYYSECMTYLPRKICGKPTYIRYHCCTGFERVDPDSDDCNGVVPIEDLMTTARNLYLKEFRNFIRQSNMEDLMTQDDTALTLFGPHNKAFQDISEPKKFALSTDNRMENLLSLHLTPGRYELKDLYDGQLLPSLLPGPTEAIRSTKVRINKYSNGIVTANCARIILPDQVATNGVLHVTEKIMEPIEDQGTIMDLLLQDGRFEELVTALIVSGLATELRESGTYTLVAPTDDAFHAAPEEVLQRILTDKDMLKRLLQYHLLEDNYCTAAVVGPISLRSLEGQKVNLTCGEDDTVTVNGVPIIDADILATNGVVHAVNEILIPDAAKSLGERLSDLGLLQFMEYAQSSGLADVLDGSQPGNFTVFAPNAEAFEKLSKDQKRILQTNTNVVKKVFKYHVVEGKHDTKTLKGNQDLTPAESLQEKGDISAKIHVKVYHEDFGVNNAKIVSSNHQAGNGVIHIIDRIMFPPEESIQEKIKNDPQLSTFRNVLREADMFGFLAGMTGNITIFAPNNDAFAEMDSGVMRRITRDPDQRDKFIKYHVLQKPIYSSGVRPSLQYRFRTLAGEEVRMQQDDEAEPIRVNDEAVVVEPDVETTNGVMHVVDSVLKCPCVGEFGDA